MNPPHLSDGEAVFRRAHGLGLKMRRLSNAIKPRLEREAGLISVERVAAEAPLHHLRHALSGISVPERLEPVRGTQREQMAFLCFHLKRREILELGCLVEREIFQLVAGG